MRKSTFGRVAGSALKIAEAVTSPLVPADYLDLFAPLRSGADLRARVLTVTRETTDAVTVRLQPGRSWRPHVPGQYIRIGIDVDGVRTWRAYSLTSGRDEKTLTFTTKVIPGGLLSNHISTALRPGTLISLDQATGDFVLPDPAPPQVLFITAGSGITPVMGMLRQHRLRDAVLVHSAPTPEAVIFGPELRERAARGEFRFVEWHTGTHGLLSHAAVVEAVPDWARRPTWLCGPTALLNDFTSRWEAVGLGAQLHTERFRPSIQATGEGGRVSFVRSGVTIDAPAGRPLLDVGEEAGVLMPSGCRMGICFGCSSRLQSGATIDLRNGELTLAHDGDDVHVQTCISAPAGDCRIDL